ncbi:MAG: hypothetical protein KC613_12755, partial [Myxococcales bacterium]|nr:hypothetical protein [Myxococcales bacterium]
EGEGQVTCWGDAADGRTAPPPGPHVALAVGRDFACAIDAASALACWGAMPNGEAQVPAGAFTQLSAGDGFACALDETGAAVCWGRRGEFSQPP